MSYMYALIDNGTCAKQLDRKQQQKHQLKYMKENGPK